MSDDTENFESWHPPKDGGLSRNPLEASDKLWLFGKVFLIFAAEVFNIILHASNYALANPLGSDVFIVDILGLPALPALSNISVGTLINGVLGLAAVLTPVFLFGQLLDRHQEIFEDAKGFFSNGINAIVTALLVILYLLVIATEFGALYMRITIETAPSIIPSLSNSEASFWPMLIMSIALIITNAAMGLACAHIMRSTRRALKGGAS